MKHNMWAIALFAVTFASCTKEAYVAPVQNPMGVRVEYDEMTDVTQVQEFQLQAISSSLSVPMKLSVCDLTMTSQAKSSLSSVVTSFKLTAMESDYTPVITKEGQYETVTWTSGAWMLEKSYTWPSSRSRIFHAYANLPSSGASVTFVRDTQSLDYTVAESPASQTDILMGHFTGKREDGVVPLKFYHPLTSVEIVDGGISYSGINYSVSEVFITGIPASGHCTQSGSVLTWSDLSAVSTMVRSSYSAGRRFYLIPQDLQSRNAKITVVVKPDAPNSDKESLILEAVLDSGIWESGKLNIYTLGN